MGSSVLASVTRMAEQATAPLGLELVLAEVKGGPGRALVRIFIDQPGGITLEDCERFSKRLSVLLDVEDCIPFSYNLEVSSPGLDRPLVKESDYLRFAGKPAKIRTSVALEGQRNFQGRIMGAGAGRITLETAQGKRMDIALTEIEKANLVAEL